MDSMAIAEAERKRQRNADYQRAYRRRQKQKQKLKLQQQQQQSDLECISTNTNKSDSPINLDSNSDPTEFLTIKEEFLPNDVDIPTVEQAQFAQINGNLNVQIPPAAQIMQQQPHDNCDRVQSDEMEFITPKTEVFIEGYELQEQVMLHNNCDQADEMEFIKTEVYVEDYELQEQEMLQKQMEFNNKDTDHHQKHS